MVNTLLGRTKKKRGKKSSGSRKGKKGARGGRSVLDVRSPGAVGAFNNLLKKNKIVVVLVYADWCGHCHTYKKGTWNNLKSMPNRKIPIAEVNESQLPNTPLKNAKIDGYPSVLVVGNNGKSAEFKDNATGQTTNALPISNNEQAMKTLPLEEPEKVAAENNLGTAAGANEPIAEEPEPELVPNEPIEDNDTTTKPTSENAKANMLNNAESLTLNSMSGVAAEGAATGPAPVLRPRRRRTTWRARK